ncbi:MAG: class I SAM-dependent methyltransferase [Candidatus Latescibacteria bacterium]|jgi:SAM-dependent methyltransferase|nr:class I SAM-dependent methyltransferase [Candidatus Latescibacterota bacterium]
MFDEHTRPSDDAHKGEKVSLARRLMAPELGPILDIGCGTGALLRALKTCSLRIGIETSCFVVDTWGFSGNKGILRWSGIVSDGQSLPLRDSSVQNVYLVGVLEHLDNPIEALREIKRVLRKGGQALVMTPNLGRPRRLFAALRGERLRERTGHKMGWDYHLLLQVLEEVGFLIMNKTCRFVDVPWYEYLPHRLAHWLSHRVLRRWFPMVGSELYVRMRKP